MQATRRVLPVVQKQGGGAIVNTAPISGLFGDYGIAAYNGMKAGVVNSTRVVAMEYAGDNIRCNCNLPGRHCHATAATVADQDPGFRGRRDRCHPDGPPGRPEEMANVALFLAYVTGAAFVADSGLTKTSIPTRFTN
jgi:meso-butanediol dehydrogenase / (S,S)-butanediol dehydrogenase / diacetyl reductase